jgi:hypothetical protein
MLSRILKALGFRKSQRRAPADLVSVDRASIAHAFHTVEGFPHVDWGAAEAWIRGHASTPTDEARFRRAVGAAWLDEVRDTLEEDHKRWRHAGIEGLAPMADDLAVRTARGADRARDIIADALKPMRGMSPIPVVCVIALAKSKDYYSFISRYYPDEGEFGTSGGVYINEGEPSIPMIAMPMNLKHSVEQTLAHELTHHALRGLELPLWVEEGLTQMMEERVTGHTGFTMNQEFLERHQERWGEDGVAIGRFWSGDAFHSPHDDEQELAYHLAQLLVRGLLTERPKPFFAFARACAGEGVRAAADEALGEQPEQIAARALRIEIPQAD